MIASFFLLAVLILSPTAYVSACEKSEGDRGADEQQRKSKHPRFGEVVEVNTNDNTLLLKALHPRFEELDDMYVLVQYTDETVIKQDREDAVEGDVEIGEKVVVRGEFVESDEYISEVTADKIHVFDKLQPKKLRKHKSKKTNDG